MKILFLDFCSFRGHKNLNRKLLKILDKIYDITVICQKNYYSEEDKKKLGKVIFKDIPLNRKTLFSMNPFFVRLNIFINMIINLFVMRKVEYNKIIIAGYENITFSMLGFLFYSKKETYIIHHQNVDELESSFKSFLFKKTMNKVKHIVLDEFISKYLINEIGVEADKVFFISHPLTNESANKHSNNTNIDNKKVLVGISNSNDEEIIKNIMYDITNKKITINPDTEIILKSKSLKYTHENLIIINTYLEKDKYDFYINNAYAILILFPSTFKYRMSGTLIDAILNKKVVIGTNIPCINAFNERYPSVCKIANNLDEILNIVNSELYTGDTIKDFDTFKHNHSNENILCQLRKIIGD